MPRPTRPLVDSDLFDRAQGVLTARGDNYSLRASSPSDYILAGLVRCQRCGRHYVGWAAHGRGGRHRYYTCWSRQRYGTDHCDSDRLSAFQLEAAIVESLRRTFAQRPLVQKALRAWAAGNEAARPKYEEQLTQTDTRTPKGEEAIERYPPPLGGGGPPGQGGGGGGGAGGERAQTPHTGRKSPPPPKREGARIETGGGTRRGGRRQPRTTGRGGGRGGGQGGRGKGGGGGWRGGRGDTPPPPLLGLPARAPSQPNGAGDGARTRNFNLGKVALYR